MPKMNPGAMKGKGGVPMKKAPLPKGIFKKFFGSLFHYYKGLVIVVMLCIVLSAVAGLASSYFQQQFTDEIIDKCLNGSAVWADVVGTFVTCVIAMGTIYIVGVINAFIWTRIMAVVTQGMLKHYRDDMFSRMQSLPIKYFDTNAHGDIMSTYTNDVDAVRQFISQSLPNIFSTMISVVSLLTMMLLYSVYLTLAVLIITGCMFLVIKHVGGSSAKYMMAQQKTLAVTEGVIEEMMNGQKVVKVFTHEEESKQTFDKYNDELCEASTLANRYGNELGPILGNIGNLMYVLMAFLGALLVIFAVPNLTVAGFKCVLTGESVMTVGVIVAFLSLVKQFTQSVFQISQQVAMVSMGLAGFSRICALMEEEPEHDEGYVTLCLAKKDENGNLTETTERTGLWAWKHYHKADGTIDYRELKGDIVMENVDFGYVPEKTVLHDITLYARPGQKVAFVGATGAGKTTITNLINRFYDIQDGKIRYDGINITKIKKSDLRRSLGIVLQDVNLFTGTVMENIRYGRLDATDEECIAAAKLSNADDFICRLPQGYNTMLTNNGANLSQGQRQLLSIARAAVADTPAMILDEATSSIDTRTEALVQDGMDKLMQGRTVFVIAHRLSTVMNSDVIMVLDHGKIIERGTHQQLIDAKGVYYQLFTGAFELE